MVKVFPGCATSRMGSLGLSGWVAIERDVIYVAYQYELNQTIHTLTSLTYLAIEYPHILIQ